MLSKPTTKAAKPTTRMLERHGVEPVLRRPDPDETGLSEAEIDHGVRASQIRTRPLKRGQSKAYRMLTPAPGKGYVVKS